MMGTIDPARVRLGRIRCLINTVECMKKGELLPEPICFVPKELNFEYEGEEALCISEEPKDGAKVVAKLPEKKATTFVCSGQPLFNSQGGWMQIMSPHKGWVLLQPQKSAMKGEGETSEETGGRKRGSGRLVEGCGADVFTAVCQAASPE